MDPNERQVGGNHYQKVGGEQHWDRAWRLKYDCFQYIITKWVERWRDKGGVEDLRKAHHALEKYISMVEVVDSPKIHPNINVDPAFVRPVPLYHDAPTNDDAPPDTKLWIRGYHGVDLAHFECRKCGASINAHSFTEAEAIHGDCAGRAYVRQD
jgi:hypothetical protein